MRVLIVDDEPLARSRLRRLLVETATVPSLIAEAGHADAALHAIADAAAAGQPLDVVLLDIHMPGTGGMELARALQHLPQAPVVIFVTAHAEHALDAFETQAADYLTKPVRRERLAMALQKAELLMNARSASKLQKSSKVSSPEDDSLLISDHGRSERVRLSDVLYFKSELKYVTVRTAAGIYLWSGSLGDLEMRLGPRFVRVHRNALVAPAAMRGLERVDGEDGVWLLYLFGLPAQEALRVSRRQLPQVRALLAGEGIKG